jgi:acetylornithine/succinyldiaminopimelate/putrescine aminotransferase
LLKHISGVKLAIGQNDKLFDFKGKSYIDFTSGIFCCNIGYANPYIIDVYERHARPGQLQHTYTFEHDSREKYLETLCAWSGYPYAYLFSSGTEATEAAWKVMARMTGRPAIQGMGKSNNAFHGKTMGARIMAGSEPSHLSDQPAERTCGIITEPYNPLYARLHPMAQIERIEQLIKDHGLLLCLDEIQAGFGRTGKKFGYEHYYEKFMPTHMGMSLDLPVQKLPLLKPDFVCIGKGQGNGYPISGLLSKHDLDNPDFELSSTHGGNPLACEIGTAVINYIKDFEIIRKAQQKGEILKEELDKLEVDTHCIGLVAALVLTSKEQADALVQAAALRGLLLVHTGCATVKIGPPLTVQTDNLINGCHILKQALDEVLK